MHGETCCDETLLPYWCPISGDRLSTDPQPSSPASVNSSDSRAGMQAPEQQQAQAVPAADVQSWAAEQQHREPTSAAAAPRASSTSTRSSSFMQLGSAQQVPAPALPPSGRAAVSTARSDAIEALKRSMHEDPASKPAADVLLFNKAKQLPIVNWTGPIKHKASGRVVELCSLTLQVGRLLLIPPASLQQATTYAYFPLKQLPPPGAANQHVQIMLAQLGVFGSEAQPVLTLPDILLSALHTAECLTYC